MGETDTDGGVAAAVLRGGEVCLVYGLGDDILILRSRVKEGEEEEVLFRALM